ncbi:MAG: hypothetical protein KKA19_05750, partial [Candidatus Margulisbacteria bacterium]|nr:hypothetical protein [Candidatus Margulisiibacteriota bacterium]
FSWKNIIKQIIEVWHQKYQEAQQDTDFSKKDTFYTMPHFQLFKHYASQIIDLNYKVKATEQGIKQIQTKKPLEIHKELKGKIYNDEAKLIISFAKDKILLADLFNKMKEVYNDLSENEFMQHVLWGLKHNLLQVE